jgi:hypothetical protein
MIASRFWFGLLGLALSGALFVLYLAISMHDRLGVRMVSEGLSADSRVVSWYLKNSAREGAAQLIRFAANESVARTLSAASRASDPAQIDPTARRQLKATLAKIAAEMPKAEAFDAVFAVSQSGEVVAHIGFEQATNIPDFELGGYPVVADALHGYVRDDTLVFDRLYRVVARPVEFELGQLPAGAIVGARLVDDAFAAELSERTGAAIAFYSNGRRQATGVPSGFDRTGLDQVVSDLPSLDQDADYKDKGRTDVHELPDGLAVVYARLPGEAWQLGAGYAVARQAPGVDGLFGVLKQADGKDKEAVNHLLLVAVALLAAGVGLLLSYWEYTNPLKAFRRQVKALSAGGAAQLAVDKLRGPFRQLALDLNLALDRVSRARGDEAPISVGFDQMFGDAAPPSSMSAFGLPGSVPPASGAGGFGQPTAPMSSQAFAPVSPAAPPRRASPVHAAAQSSFGSTGAQPTFGSTFGNAAAQPAYEEAPDLGYAGFPNGAAAEPIVVPPVLPNSDFGYASAADLGGSAAFAPPGEGAPQLNGTAEVEPEWTQVYHDFVRIKQDCGEAVEGFTFERFTSTLRKNRETLMRQHGVQHVQFSAYVKQGRAALKAKPVRE